ncbi:MAG: hypothetical protein U0Y68_22125 [Blastocatellia bacterium]
MDNITLEQVESMADQLSTEDQGKLIEHLEQRIMRPSVTNGKKPQSLRGIWKGAFPENFDIDAALHEIRHEWEKEWPEVFEQ